MTNQYEKVFMMIPVHEPCAEVFDRVMARIEKAEIRRARLQFVGHALISLAALIAVVPAFSYIWNYASNSGFAAYLSIIISDWSYLLANWQPLLLSIIETMPILEISLALFIVGLFAYSLRRTIECQSAFLAHSRYYSTVRP